MNSITRINKTLAAAVTAITALGALAVDGYTTQEKYAASAIVVGVVLVFFTPNSEEVPDPDEEEAVSLPAPSRTEPDLEGPDPTTLED